jgi:hypothetical protein
MQKIISHYSSLCLRLILFVAMISASAGQNLKAQDSAATAKKPEAAKKSYVKNTFDGNFLIHDATVMVPQKKSLEFDLSHRFGVVNNGWKDLFGIFGGANIRLGFTYVPIQDLQVGFGVSNFNMQVDGNLKYAILKQTRDNAMPVSVTYFGNLAIDTREESSSLPIVDFSDRLSYYNQILVARKFSNELSVQFGFSFSHYNNVLGYYDESGNIQPTMNNNNFFFSFGGRYKISPGTAIIIDYDQPLTQNPTNNPHPNISFGFEFQTSGHTFQVFAGNYAYTLPQDNGVYNQNDFTQGQYVIGFNLSRLWNF